jgi:ribosomal protein S18 acetylase RimI-like enzyme
MASSLYREPRVRAPTPRELDRVAELWLALLRHHAAAGPRFEPGPEASEHIRAELQAWSRSADVRIVVAVDEQLAGFCIARILRRSELFRETSRGEIDSIFVPVASRGRGIARRLVDDALAWLRQSGVRRVELSVDATNPEGRAFWQRIGFEPAMDVLERRL